jgi:hypothetical protein
MNGYYDCSTHTESQKSEATTRTSFSFSRLIQLLACLLVAVVKNSVADAISIRKLIPAEAETYIYISVFASWRLFIDGIDTKDVNSCHIRISVRVC